jgi:ubiquinone/menaquinone biosynthesis C-methylase UbiE
VIEPLILDLACGDYKTLGTLGVDLGSVTLTGSKSSIDVAASAYALPFQNEVFDGVICRHFLEHIDTMRVLNELNRVCKKNAKITIDIPNSLYLFILVRAFLRIEAKPWSGECPHIHIFGRPEIRNLLRETGFKTLMIEHYTEWRLSKERLQQFKQLVMRFVDGAFPFFSRHLRVYAIKEELKE